MKKYFLIILIILINSHIYCIEKPKIEEFLSWLLETFGQDENAGLTSFPTLLIPAGGKYEAMGTAYTAVPFDVGFIEANPSVSSVLEQSQLAFNHKNWIADVNLESVYFTQRRKQLGYGGGIKLLWVPFTGYDTWGERNGMGYFTEMIGSANIAYNFFSSYYFSGISAGSNLKFAYRGVSSSIYPGQSAFSAMMDFGLFTQFDFLEFYAWRGKNFRIGLALKNIGFPAAGDPLPSSFTGGFSWAILRPLTLAVDWSYPFTLDTNTKGGNWSLASGVNITVTDFLAFQAGFLFFYKNPPRFSIGTEIKRKPFQLTVSYSLDIGTQLKLFDRISVQASILMGDRGRQEKKDRILKSYLKGLEFYAQGQLNKAIEKWEEVLSKDKHYQPAKEMIEAAKKSLELQRKMREKQEIE